MIETFFSIHGELPGETDDFNSIHWIDLLNYQFIFKFFLTIQITDIGKYLFFHNFFWRLTLILIE